MPPPLAATLTIAFIGFLFWNDSRKDDQSSAALWLPVIWLFIIGSKFISQWLNIFGLPFGSASQEDGSPLDAVFFLLLILAGIFVLARRKFSVSWFAENNQWLTVFLVYSFLAIIWSDFPFVAVKRWIKSIGHPVMALVVLTDPAPNEAIQRALKRAGYLLLPPSILFIKYFPQFGRSFDLWSGTATNSGIMNNKNELGYVCMMFGLFFLWHASSLWRARRRPTWREVGITVTFLWIIGWLFSVADSATSLACVVVGAATMAIVGLPIVSKRFIGSYIVIALLVIGAAQLSFGMYDNVVALLGRNATLTDRTVVWQDALAIDDSPVFGAGFESFWLGPRLDKMWAKWWWHPIQAHNGYIETYLNSGWVGLAILIGLLVATFRKARLELLRNLNFGLFRLSVLFAIIIYNYTEATFKGVHLVWSMFYLIAIDYPATEPAASKVTAENISDAPEVPARLMPTLTGRKSGKTYPAEGPSRRPSTPARC